MSRKIVKSSKNVFAGTDIGGTSMNRAEIEGKTIEDEFCFGKWRHKEYKTGDRVLVVY